MRTLVVVSALFIVLFAILGTRKSSVTLPLPEKAETVETPLTRATTTEPQQFLPRPGSVPESATPRQIPAPFQTPVPLGENAEPLGDGVFLVNDPEAINARLKIVHQMDLRYLESSPAKNTPEAKAIEGMLAKRGISRAAVPLCYNAAYDYAAFIALGTPEQVALMHLEESKNRLAAYGYGEVDEGFWQELIALKPKMFFGHKDYTRSNE